MYVWVAPYTGQTKEVQRAIRLEIWTVVKHTSMYIPVPSPHLAVQLPIKCAINY